MKVNGMFARSIACVLAASGSLIVSESALAQGADSCSNATSVDVNVPAPINTANATTSPEPVDATQCPGTALSWGSANKDVWFKFLAPSDGVADFSTCAQVGFDTSLVIYKGTDCTSMVQVACNGDGTGQDGCQPFYSRVANVAAVAGDVFFIRVGGWTDPDTGVAASGGGSLTVRFAGVLCSSATGDCREAHGGLGCNDPFCCEAVCSANPLCCEFEWDADCVALVPDQCGLFVYSCPGTGTPANDCATNAQVVTQSGSLPWSNVGATEDGPDHSGAVCLSGGDTFPHDIWWRVTAPASGLMTVSTCGTVPFDNKMAVYDLGTDPSSFDFNDLPDVLVGCNDDGPDPCLLSDSYDTYASEVTVGVEVGRTYLVRMGSFEDDETLAETGSGTIQFTLPTACQIDATTSLELEPCGEDTNSACVASGFSELISLGTSRKGTMWADGGFRDVDFYRFTVPSDTEVTLDVSSASFVQVGLYEGNIAVADCDGIEVIATASGTCDVSVSRCLVAGEYYVLVGAARPNGGARFDGLPCGSGTLNEYSLSVAGTAATCPAPPTQMVNGACPSPGPDTRQLSGATTANNLPLFCQSPCAAQQGGTRAASFAVKAETASLLNEVSCVRFGVYAGITDVDAGACNYYTVPPEFLFPGNLSVYRDTDAGEPFFPIDGSNGGDLELIESYDLLIPGGFYVGSLPLPEPLCLEGESSIVFVFTTTDLEAEAGVAGLPANIGLRLRPSFRAVPGTVSNMYIYGCGFAAFTRLTNTWQWPFSINGTALASCSGSDCPADLDNPPDGVVGGTDLAALLAAWGTNSPDVELDTPPNNVISGTDLAVLLAAWGSCAP